MEWERVDVSRTCGSRLQDLSVAYGMLRQNDYKSRMKYLGWAGCTTTLNEREQKIEAKSEADVRC